MNWNVSDSIPPFKRYRKPTLDAVVFFENLPVGKSAIIPLKELSTARNAAAVFAEKNPGFVIRFRNEVTDVNKAYRAWKEPVKKTAS